jgi:hypothetical protein
MITTTRMRDCGGQTQTTCPNAFGCVLGWLPWGWAPRCGARPGLVVPTVTLTPRYDLHHRNRRRVTKEVA